MTNNKISIEAVCRELLNQQTASIHWEVLAFLVMILTLAFVGLLVYRDYTKGETNE